MAHKPKRLAVFDIDGTIFRKNLHFELINEMAWLGSFPNEVRKELTRLYSDWIEHERTYDEYRRALVALYAEHIKGHAEDEVIRASKILVPFHAKRTYVFAEKLISDLRRRGYHIIAVSGSPIEVVKTYNDEYLRFDFAFGSVYERDDKGRYTGRAVFEPSRGKGEIVKQYAYEHGISLEDSYGVGDTESDISFLGIVSHPIAFNPNRGLYDAARKSGWRIVVEKKDVVYEIDGQSLKDGRRATRKGKG